MGYLTSTRFTAFIDKLTAEYLALRGTAGSGYGLGDATLSIGSDWGASRKARDLEAIVLGWEDYDLSTGMLAVTHRQQTVTAMTQLLGSLDSQVVLAIQNLCQAAGLGVPLT